eukprot:GHVS01101746.1.p2 GENE.GHVS01101746.1~~GHVS01101746.1.p2  ORF type:complete len:102 (+),score=2.11 GHVS01101746.1:64-369(+)
MATREWKDGLFSKTMRSLSQIPSTNLKWIILDGDLEANWIESMNSVTDDNKILTLPSNDRIPLTAHTRIELCDSCNGIASRNNLHQRLIRYGWSGKQRVCM